MTNLTDMLSKFVNSNTASTSGSGTLPSNTITNPIVGLKGFTTPKVGQGAIQTNNGSTKDVQPLVVQVQSQVPNSEPVVDPVSAPMPNPKPSIPYPSRRNDEKRREKANDQVEKFYKIFQDMSFEISLADALILMPKFASTLKALIGNKEKLSEMARTPLNEHCSAWPIQLLIMNPIVSTLLRLSLLSDSDFHLEEVDAFSSLEDDQLTGRRLQTAVQHQRRVNPKIHDVIKKEVEKLLDAGLIYPISDSPWVSPVHCVPKKGGFTVVENDENELILTRLVTGWRVCIDYQKLNEATRKDHFPLPFMDQMLERLAGNEYYCFLDGFSGYFQIPIDPHDQEKTTFMCPYGTFAYRRMPFGLCNAPGTFQRCMMAIFHDMIEKMMEVFMDDFLVFGNSFENCLSRVDKMLQRCEDTNLCLNWEKSHFMVKEGIVLGHKISKKGIEVDKAKIDVIAKLPHPTTVKGVRSFLGHAGFY
ncbi:reverse transcriptase domain-containing protein [Tanacetum coccineum]